MQVKIDKQEIKA